MDTQNILLHQRILNEAKRWQLASFLLIGVVGVLVFAITSILPLKTVEVRYVEFFDSAKHSFKIIPSPLSKEQKILLLRQQLRDYVMKRIAYTGNVNIDTPAVMQVASMSTTEVVAEFKKIYERIHNETSIERREVEIIADIVTGKNVHQIDYKTIDYHNGKTYENEWEATVVYELRNQIVTEDSELFNPLGIVVTKFYQTKRKLDQEQLNEIF